MKQYMYKSLLLLLVVYGTACNKMLNTQPTQSIDQTAALNTSSDVLVALTGAYADMGVENAYGGLTFVAPDLLGNFAELNWSGTYQGMTQIYNKTIPIDNNFTTQNWLTSYKAINDVNNVLSALNVVTADKKASVEGQAKFIRGAMYFDLVRLFAKAWNDGDPTVNDGVPLVLSPTEGITDANKVKRNKVSEVYAQVISDLTTAESLLPVTNGFYANKAAASAMLARVYLQKGDYANAAAAANRAITTATANGFALTPTYAAAFPAPYPPAGVANTTEDLFAMQVTPTSGYNTFNEYYSPLSRGDIQINQAHLNLYEPGDARLGLFYNSGGSIYTAKFDNLYGNVHIIRLAEMYLTRAEANFRMGTQVGDAPVNDINKIRQRVNLLPYTAVTLTLAAILKERKLELAFEGFTLHDIKRTQGTVGPLNFDSPKLVFPIPKREIIVNPNLTQNAGY